MRFWERPRGRLFSAVVLTFAFALGSGTVGCRTTSEDVHRWANTQNGPRKLIAVLTHAKYPLELRVEAALTLVRMKPRSGRRVGILGGDDQPGLVDALAQLAPVERSKILDSLVPSLVAEMKKPPAPGGEAAVVDTTFPYKDAAFALLTHESGALITDDKNRQMLRAALIEWSMTDFAERMDESSQIFGTEQVLRELKADGVRRLPDLIEPNAKKIDRIADLVADLGDAETKLRASQKLVDVAKEVASERWIQERAPSVEAANKASKLNPTPAQFKAQLDQYQEEELLRVFASMKRVGGRPAVDYLLGFAQDSRNSEKKRAAALAVLEGNIDKNNPKHAESLLKIAAGKNTPDTVRDIALRRVGELPRPVVLQKLYGLFDDVNWKVRWVAAELVLKISEAKDVDEFMQRLGKAKGLSITEPLRYGALIGELRGRPDPKQLIDRYARPGHPVQARLAALGWYYENGTKAQLGEIARYAGDKQKVPECNKNATDCEWKCQIGSGNQAETKEIKTVGEFVTYCIKPAMEKRETVKKEKKK